MEHFKNHFKKYSTKKIKYEQLEQLEKYHKGILKTEGGLYFSKMSQFQFGNFETEGRVFIFQKCPNFNYLIVYFAILPL